MFHSKFSSRLLKTIHRNLNSHFQQGRGPSLWNEKNSMKFTMKNWIQKWYTIDVKSQPTCTHPSVPTCTWLQLWIAFNVNKILAQKWFQSSQAHSWNKKERKVAKLPKTKTKKMKNFLFIGNCWNDINDNNNDNNKTEHSYLHLTC